MKLLDFGSLNIDHTYQLPHLARPGETLASDSYHKSEGGKGFNQAVALAKAGQEVYLAGAIGQDGLFLRDYLQELGVHTEQLRVLDAPTGHAMIQLDAEGQNCIILFSGTNGMITEAMIDEVLTEFDRVISLPRLKAIHLNDSQNERGSHKDRHARIGEGHIGLDALVRVVRHPALKDLPFILETPNDAAGYAREIALLREKAAQ